VLEHLEEAAGRVDAARYENGVAVPALQPVPGLHVELDVSDYLVQPVTSGQRLLYGAPALLELGLGEVGQPLGLQLEPLVDLRLRCDVLVDVARLVAQVQHHTVAHRLVVLVGMDVGAEGLDAAALVGLEQGRPE